MLKYLAVALGLLWAGSVAAQPQPQGGAANVLATCGTASYPLGMFPVTQDQTGKECVNATLSASIGGFTALTTGTPIAVTTGGVTGTLPAGAVVVATNVGTTNGAYCALGASATTASQYIAPNGGWFQFTVGGSTQLTCITSSSTTTVNTTGGSGLPTGTGGGGGSSGGGGGTAAADESAFTFGTTQMTPIGGVYQTTATSNPLTNGQTGAVQLTIDRAMMVNLRNASGAESGVAAVPLQVSVANTAANGTAILTTGTGGTFPITAASLPLPTGAATSANQVTTPATGNGTTNANTQRVTISSDSTGQVAVASSALPTGAATSANQSTEITSLATIATNTGAAIPAGTAIIGKVGIDQTTPGTTNGVALSSINITATDCSGTVVTGGTAVNAFTAQTTLHGFTIKNTDASAGSGEPLWISFTTTAAAGTAASYPLAAPATTTFANGESYTAPTGFGLNHALSVVAATSGHKFSCTWW